MPDGASSTAASYSQRLSETRRRLPINPAITISRSAMTCSRFDEGKRLAAHGRPAHRAVKRIRPKCILTRDQGSISSVFRHGAVFGGGGDDAPFFVGFDHAGDTALAPLRSVAATWAGEPLAFFRSDPFDRARGGRELQIG